MAVKHILHILTAEQSLQARFVPSHSLVLALKKEEIKRIMGYSFNYENNPLLTNSRQIGLLESSFTNIENALKEIEKDTPIDLVAIDIVKSLNNIEDILGNRSKVNLSEEIFSRFCLGK